MNDEEFCVEFSCREKLWQAFHLFFVEWTECAAASFLAKKTQSILSISSYTRKKYCPIVVTAVAQLYQENCLRNTNTNTIRVLVKHATPSKKNNTEFWT